MKTVGLPTWDCRKQYENDLSMLAWPWPFWPFRGYEQAQTFADRKKIRKSRLGWVFSKASDSVYVKVDLIQRDKTEKRGRHKRPWTWRHNQGRCHMDTDAGCVWVAYVSRHWTWWRPCSSRFYSSVREYAFFYSLSLPFLFFISIFCQSGMKAQGALELT